MTILDNLITLAQITGSIDVQCSFNGDWYVRHSSQRTQGVVHIVTHGTGYLKLDNEAQARQLQRRPHAQQPNRLQQHATRPQYQPTRWYHPQAN